MVCVGVLSVRDVLCVCLCLCAKRLRSVCSVPVKLFNVGHAGYGFTGPLTHSCAGVCLLSHDSRLATCIGDLLAGLLVCVACCVFSQWRGPEVLGGWTQ